MLQVLLAGFGEVARRGIRAILSSPELVIDECAIERVMSAVVVLTPDVVVIEAGVRELARAERVASTCPAVTVVACSASEATIRIFPRFCGGQYRSRPLSAEALRESVRDR
ncbi:hypothetical protein C6A87_002460 [Mycobacterium sp. ITM-2016-00317]|uniref:hypothetical protein n=1 Tax=Mycobacterium sp. ITM-2016-00317 TaxID=2099694 RepID=UPI00287FD048|nr:hypothetical protein [Mycobacterium sp. ITM-2016-00317]WNG88144.1 hypothetical protein C6A87_002460 [Mycobacterium sp. ITM-2016-00317]